MSELLDVAAARLRVTGIENPQKEARLLLAHAINVPQEKVIAGAEPDAAAQKRFGELLERREAREPLAYITGHREFWSLEFAVGPGALIPRPETETLIEQALKEFPDPKGPLRVFDLGTGTGCLLIAFLKERRQATGIGSDISDDALAWAKRNIESHGLANRARLVRADWTDGIGGPFEVIFCNPPYVAEELPLEPEVAHYEPATALMAGPDGLAAYCRIAPRLARLLVPMGRAFIELGQNQAVDAQRIFTEAGLKVLRMVPDLAGIPRCIVAATGP